MTYAVRVARSGDPAVALRDTGRTPARAYGKLRAIADSEAGHLRGHAGPDAYVIEATFPDGVALALVGPDVDFVWVGLVADVESSAAVILTMGREALLDARAELQQLVGVLEA